MRPSRHFLIILMLFAVAAVFVALLELDGTEPFATLGKFIWWGGFFTLLVAAVADGVILNDCRGRRNDPLIVRRTLPGSFAVGVGNRVSIYLENSLNRTLKISVTDHYPAHIQIEGLPAEVPVPPQTATKIKYWAHPNRRGDAQFGAVDVRITSRWGLWEFRRLYSLDTHVSVYPNFTAITLFEQLGHDQQINQMGLHVMQRRGQGMDFHQLREYRDGDTSRQIDWKASSRLQKLISRDYQDERDQDIIFLLDSGRRMRAKDGELSHFDHCLNSLLLLSYVALRQGDAVGVLSFAGSDRWLAPVKGKANINLVLNSVYNLHSSTDTSDLVEAASNLMVRHRKRALVIVLTNVREEDKEDVVAATRLLSRRHLVLVASLRETFLDDAINEPVQDFRDGLIYSQTMEILTMRRRLLETLRAQGVVVTDSIPQQLHVRLVNEYWALKRSGRI